MAAKYVIFSLGLGPIARLGGPNDKHLAMLPESHDLRLISAGFVQFAISEGKVVVQCFGDSESLRAAKFPPENCVSRPDRDAAIVQTALALSI